MASRSPTMVITQRLWSESISRSSSETPGIFMASTMASTLALSRPSEKLGTHSTSVDITDENSCAISHGATRNDVACYVSACSRVNLWLSRCYTQRHCKQRLYGSSLAKELSESQPH